MTLLTSAMAFLSFAGPSGDRGLIRRALAGESKATDTLVRRLMPVIRARTVRTLRRTGDVSAFDVDDLAHDVWLSLIEDGARRLRTWSPEGGASLETYVGLLAEREVHNRLRFAHAAKRGGGVMHTSDFEEIVPGDPSGTERAMADRDLLRGLLQHLEEVLSARDFLAFRLLYTDQLDVSEVARSLKATPQALYNIQHRIRRAARGFAALQESAG